MALMNTNLIYVARQSLKKRKIRYQEKREEQFEKVQETLENIQRRLVYGSYPYLTDAEKVQIKSLLDEYIIEEETELSVRMGFTSSKVFDLRSSQPALNRILRILSVAGKRAPPKPRPVRVILRRAGKVLNAAVPKATDC